MDKLTENELVALAASKGFVVDNLFRFITMDSELNFHCTNGHLVKGTPNDLSKIAGCPKCLSLIRVDANKLPTKSGYRVVGFDQATLNFGVSVFDDERLICYDVWKFSGATNRRLVDIGRKIEEVCRDWQPDLIVYEDIQYQQTTGGYMTFKVLAELKGVVGYEIEKAEIPNICVMNKVWQSLYKIKGKGRVEQKLAVIEKVKELYPSITDLTDDAADAILIGKYGVDKRRTITLETLF